MGKKRDLRIIHEHVDLLEFLGQLVDETPHLVGLADVELHGEHRDVALADLGLDVGGDLPQRVDAARREHELETARGRRRPRELKGRAAADPGRRARHQHRLAGEALRDGRGHGARCESRREKGLLEREEETRTTTGSWSEVAGKKRA